MKIVKLADIEKNSEPEYKNITLTIGTFDGVHKGHRTILEHLKNIAKQNNSSSAILTFEPHPRKLLFPDETPPKLINTQEEKKNILKEIDINLLIICNFNENFAKLTSREFVKNILIDKLNVKTLIIGYDHKIGSDKENNPLKISTSALPYRLDVLPINAFEENGEKISSTKIRNLISHNQIEKANIFLGYNYSISGIVTSGNKIGTKIGFPTANIIPDQKEKLIPAQGVYKVLINIDNQQFTGMANIGTRPTFSEDNQISIEINIFDFNKDIYNKKITVSFIKFIRNEIKFSSQNELINQLIEDKKLINVQ